MIIKKFSYANDKNLTELKKICKQCGSNALKKTFEYLKILFYFTKPEKVISEYIPDVAYYVATISKQHIRIVDIGVVENSQHKGIGKILLDRVIEQANHLKIDKITLRTSSYETAFIFYLKMGFNVVGMTGDDLEMEKCL